MKVYYIAEAGVNRVIHDISKEVHRLSDTELSHKDFFAQIDDYIIGLGQITFDEFEESFGQQPKTIVTIALDGERKKDENVTDYSKATKSYTINSTGQIGKRKRTVTTSIEISHGIEVEERAPRHPAFDYVMYSGAGRAMVATGGANITGSTYAPDFVFEATGTEIEGTIVSEKSVVLKSAVSVAGNIYAMDGTVELLKSDIVVDGDIYATDDVILSHGTKVKGNIFTSGNVELKSSNVTVEGDINAAGNIKLGSKASVQNVYAHGNVDFISDSGDIKGELHAGGNVNLGPEAKTTSIYTLGNIQFSSNNTIDGDINAAGHVGDKDQGNSITINGSIFSDSYVVTKASQNYKVLNNVYAKGKVINGETNTIYGNVVSGTSVVNDGIIRGNVIENGSPIEPEPPKSPIPPDFSKYQHLHVKPPLKIFEIGNDNVTENNNSAVHNIAPGNYRDFIAKWNDTIKMSSGDYYFNAFNAEQSAIKLYLDLSKGPINVYVKSDISFASGLTVFVSSDGKNFKKAKDLWRENPALALELAGKVYWETHNNFSMAGDGFFIGTVLANNNINVGSNATLIGSYIVNEGTAEIKYGPTIVFAPPTESAAGIIDDPGSPGDDNDEGVNIIKQSMRVTTKTPIREQ